MNEKTPNKRMYIVENKDITWEYDEDSLREKILEVLNQIRIERSQINFDSEAARQGIASVIADELWKKKRQINTMHQNGPWIASA